MDPTTGINWSDLYGKVAVLVQWAFIVSMVCVGSVVFIESVFTPIEKMIAAVKPEALEKWKGIFGALKPVICMPLGAWSVMQAHLANLIELGDGPMGWQLAMFLGMLGAGGAPIVYRKWVKPWLPWTNGKPEPEPPAPGGN